MSGLRLFWLFVTILLASCQGRPQNQTHDEVKSARLSNVEESFFAPGQWQPVIENTGVRIDQAPSSVRLSRDLNVTNNSPTNETSTRAKSPSPLGDAIKMVASQLLQSRGAIDESDVRTPPKLKAQLKKEDTTEGAFHNGMAIPVILDDAPDHFSNKETSTKKVPTTLKAKPTTTKKPVSRNPVTRTPVTSQPDGLTTWVFLSNSSPANTLQTSTEMPSSTSIKTVSTTKTSEVTTKKVLQKQTEKTPISRKPAPLFTSSGTKPIPNKFLKTVDEEIKNGTAAEEASKKPAVEIAFRRKVTVPEVSIKPLPTVYPIGAKDSAEVIETSTEAEKTTKRVSTDKKKKKRRRRPAVKKPIEEKIEIESKIDEDTKVAAKPKPKPKPMGTRIYNYLAREVMPSVGVGLIGLVGLAGLAGLILYPFGGGALPIRRNYDTAPNPNYYYQKQGYDNNNDGGQNEEEVLGKVIAGMKDPSYMTGEQYPDVASRTPTEYTDSDNKQYPSSYHRYDTSAESKEEPDSYSNYNMDQRTRYQEPDYTRYDTAGRISSHQERETVEVVTAAPVTASPPTYAPKTEPTPVYLSNNWGVVKEEKVDKAQALMYRSEEPIYGQQAEVRSPTEDEEVRLRQSSQYSGVSRVGVGQQRRNVAVEHGPRRLRRSNDEDLSENEIEVEGSDLEKRKTQSEGSQQSDVKTTELTDDGQTSTLGPEEEITKDTTDGNESIQETQTIISTEQAEEASTIKVIFKIADSDAPSMHLSTSTEKKPEVITIEPETQEDPSLVGLIRRVAEFKLRLGISFLRNTSQAFTRYLDGMQKRVEDIVKDTNNRMTIKKRDPMF